MAVTFYNAECGYAFVGKRAAGSWIRRAAQAEGKRVGEVAVIFCTDSYLIDINRRFLDHDYLTDIITFDYCDPVDPGTIAGELYISIDTVAANAAEFAQSPRREMLRVIIHGIMHLCGYGDKSDEEAATMRRKEDFYLDLVDF